MCASFSKEELIKIILDLDRENQELREKIKAEQQKRNEKFAKPNAPKKRRMRPGQKPGHVGMTRPVPDHIDEILEQTLCECPACHHSLNESVEVIEQVQEDIIPAHVRVRKYRRQRYYCQGCQKIVTAPYHPQQVPGGYLGANVLIQAAILKYHHCLPYEKIADMFTFLQDPAVAWNNNLTERMIRPHVIYRNRSSKLMADNTIRAGKMSCEING